MNEKQIRWLANRIQDREFACDSIIKTVEQLRKDGVAFTVSILQYGKPEDRYKIKEGPSE